MRRLLQLLYSPRHYFENGDPTGVDYPILGALVVGTTAAGIIINPFVSKATSASLSKFLTEEQLSTAIADSQKWFAAGLLLSPLFVVCKLILTASMIWMFGQLAGVAPDFRRTFRIVTASSLVVMLELWYAVLILLLRGLNKVTGPADLEVPIGLDLVLPESNLLIIGLLGRINLFEIWYVCLLVYGLATSHGSRFRNSLFAVLPTWITGSCIQVKIQYSVRALESILS